MFGLIVFIVSSSVSLAFAQYGAPELPSPLYPFNGGNSFSPAPFAPANDQSWNDFMWWKSLAGSPVESVPGLVDPYDDAPDSFNQWLLTGGPNGGMPTGITPAAYAKFTQHSNPAAAYVAYGLFSNPLGHESDIPALGSTLFQPGNDMFWLLQLLQGNNRVDGSPIDNNMIRQYSYLLNSQPPHSVDPIANYWAFTNAGGVEQPSSRKRRSADEAHEAAAEAHGIAAEAAAIADAAAIEAEETAILEAYAAEQAAIDYQEWYEGTYVPWYHDYQMQMMQYEQAMMLYEAAQMRQLVPSNPFGDVAFGNPFPFYSKTNYMQSLFTDVKGLDPQATYKEPYNKWVCERESSKPLTENDSCWIPSTATREGYCGYVEAGTCV